MTKTAKIQECKRILNAYQINSKITGVDYSFLISIFENHSEWNHKMGCGIAYLTIEKTMYGNNCFVIARADGSKTDISFMHSITPRTDIDKIKRACRNAIKDTVIKYAKDNLIFGESKCAVSEELLKIGEVHVDHYDLTFAEVFNLWIKDKDLLYLTKKINKTIDNNIETFFTDKSISQDFLQFHNKNTHLRLVTKKVNLSLIKKFNGQYK